MIYLAVPYSHADPAVMEARFQAVNRAAARLVEQGKVFFSPISHRHPIAQVLDNPLNPAWYAFDEAFMPICTEMVILAIDGWETSYGVRREMAQFKARRLPITLMKEDGTMIPLVAP